MKSSKPKVPRSKDAPKRGPEPERLKLNGDWKDAIKMSFQKKRPAGGWPK
jgi:hypothetical protein